MTKLESMEKARDKYKQLYELLESICRANIELVNKGWRDEQAQIAWTWKKEVEAVILSDDEVNEREKRK